MNKLSADEIEYQKYLAREKYIMDEMSKKKYSQYKMQQIKDQEEKANTGISIEEIEKLRQK